MEQRIPSEDPYASDTVFENTIADSARIPHEWEYLKPCVSPNLQKAEVIRKGRERGISERQIENFMDACGLERKIKSSDSRSVRLGPAIFRNILESHNRRVCGLEREVEITGFCITLNNCQPLSHFNE